MTALTLKDINFSYDPGHKILDGVNLLLPEGSVTAITGSSGCGKSTLAMIACGVIPKAIHGEFTGSVEVFGEDISGCEIYETADKISMVFQDPESQLFSTAVVDEVAFGPENLCFDSTVISGRVNYALATVGMQDFEDYPPGKLSGGQQQLIALASILSLQPRMIILDEVAAQVDEQGIILLKKAVRALKSQGKTVLIIEHGTTFETFYDQKYIMREGRLYAAEARS